LTLSGSIAHDPYIVICVTTTKELLLDLEVGCEHLNNIPSAELSKTKAKK